MHIRNYLQELLDHKISLSDVPDDERTEAICLAVVTQDGYALRHIPADKLTEDICLAAVKQYGYALKYVPVDRLTPAICLAAVVQCKGGVLAVPEGKSLEDIYLAAVKQDGLALQYVPEGKFTQEDYCEICLAAVKQNGLALRYVPAGQHTEKIYSAAVKQNGFALQYVPENMRTEAVYLAAVTQNGLALQYVPAGQRTEKICVAAVTQNGRALQYVPEEVKEGIIRKLSVSTILANNYLARQYFPDGPDFTNDIKQFLDSVKQIIVNGNITDHELRDIQLTYADKRKKKNETVVSISSDNKQEIKLALDSLLCELRKANKSNDFHLALVGHGEIDSTSLAQLNFKYITNICAQNPQIKHIHLLGCNVAKAKQPAKEKEMVKTFVSTMDAKSQLKYGLASTLQALSNDPSFQEQCLSFCKKNKLDGVYVLNKTATGGYQLFAMKMKNDSDNTACMIIEEKITDIPNKHFPKGEITNILHGQKKAISFPKQKGTLSLIRQQKNPLTLKELAAVRGLTYDSLRFEKANAKYKKDKGSYPFLATIEADPADLESSLLKKLVDAIQANNEIKQDITIQGPTKALHVDTEHRDFKVTRTYLYHEYKHSGFYSKSSNINYKKLNSERKAEIEQMKTGSAHKGDESKAKQIKVTIKKQI